MESKHLGKNEVYLNKVEKNLPFSLSDVCKLRSHSFVISFSKENVSALQIFIPWYGCVKQLSVFSIGRRTGNENANNASQSVTTFSVHTRLNSGISFVPFDDYGNKLKS